MTIEQILESMVSHHSYDEGDEKEELMNESSLVSKEKIGSMRIFFLSLVSSVPFNAVIVALNCRTFRPI